jgi:hypothetical protein
LSLLKPLFDHVDGLDFESQIYGIRDLYQALVFPLRLNPEYWLSEWREEDWRENYCVNDAGFEDLLFRYDCQKQRNLGIQKFVQQDRALGGDPPSDYIIEWFTRLLQRFVDTGASIRSEYFRFGDGATVETKRGTCSAVKWDTLMSDFPREVAVQLSVITGDDWMTPTPAYSCVLSDCRWDAADHPAHLHAVPKQWNKPRFISIEPLCKNLLQMGIGQALVDFLEKTKLAAHYIPDDQSYNRIAALIGSHCGSFVTIDLSSASDSVRNDFVVSATSRLPRFQRYIQWARTPFIKIRYELGTKYHESVFEQRKFAGMGNRLTFPMEVLVFSSIVCEVISLTTRENPWDVCWYVYGDDIVVPLEYADATMKALTSYGFTVNKTKSFYEDSGHIFRESCGLFACDGIDITPTRLSRKLQKYNEDPIRISNGKRCSTFQSNWPTSYVAIANEFYIHGLWRARSLILDSLFSCLNQRFWPVFTDDPDVGLLSSQPTNFDKRTVPAKAADAYADSVALYPGVPSYICGRSATLVVQELVLDRNECLDQYRYLPERSTAGEKLVADNTSHFSAKDKTKDDVRYRMSKFVLYETLRQMELLHPSRHEGEEPYRISEVTPDTSGGGSATTSKSYVYWRSVHVPSATPVDGRKTIN